MGDARYAEASTCYNHEYGDVQRRDDSSNRPAQPEHGRPHAHDEHAFLDARFFFLAEEFKHRKPRHKHSISITQGMRKL